MARVAQRMGIPAGLSTVGTTTLEDARGRAPDAAKWFQLYMWPDRDASAELIGRAQAAGFHVLALTVDVAVAGSRLRDVHNGLVFPPRPTLRTLGDMALHPAWWANVLTTEPLRFASLESPPTTVARVANLFDAALTPDDVDLAARAVGRAAGDQGDPHRRRRAAGGRCSAPTASWSPATARASSTCSPTPLEVLPEIVAAVGDRAEVFLDSGILTGADVVAAVAMGARACLVARAYCYGLMAGGERGVQRAADLLQAEIVRTHGAARGERRERPHPRPRPAAPAGRVGARGRSALRRPAPWRG